MWVCRFDVRIRFGMSLVALLVLMNSNKQFYLVPLHSG